MVMELRGDSDKIQGFFPFAMLRVRMTCFVGNDGLWARFELVAVGGGDHYGVGVDLGDSEVAA